MPQPVLDVERDVDQCVTAPVHPPSIHPAADVVGIVLAGSYPSTERILSGTLPRPLLPVAQIPVVSHVLRWLGEGAIMRATICSNTASRAVRHLVGDGTDTGLRIGYAEDLMPRGPAGCARDAALACQADTFVVVDATVIPNLDLEALLESHKSSGAAVTAVVHHARRATGNGDRVATPAGIYVFTRRAFEAVPAFGFQDIKEHLLPVLKHRRERVAAYVADEFCPRVLNTETYLAVNRWMVERLAAGRTDLEQWGPFTVSGGLMCHPSADVHPTATVIGPALLGPGVSIGARALIVGPTSIGADTHVASGAAVCRSVIWHNTHVGEGAFVDESVVGNGVTLARSAVLHGAVRVEPARGGALRERLMARMPSLRTAPARPAGSVVDLAVP